jgi:P-type Cu+ transporter
MVNEQVNEMEIAEHSPSRLEFPILGLTQSGGPALAQAIRKIPGVYTTNVSVRPGRLTVECDPERVRVSDLLEAVRGAGFSVAGQSLRLKVNGLYCAECVGRIEDALKAVPGVYDAVMSAATNEVKITYSTSIGDINLLAHAVESAGPYKATRAAEASQPEMDKEALANQKEYRSP